MALRMRVPPSTRVSGILFRPSFHYASAKASIETRVRELRKRATLWAALGHPQWATLFSLDPTAVGPIQALKPGAKVVALPDPVAQAARPEDREGAHAREALRAQLGVPEGRLMLLLFGVLDERKGLAEVSRALTMLRPDTARQLAVVFAGPIASRLEAQVTGWAEAARANGAVVVMRNRFMHEPEIRALLHASDGLLLCYQGHIGSSAVLIRAAGAGLPVIGATFGLLGAHIRRHRLGQAVESTDPVAIAGALDVFARTPRAGFDPEAAQRFAEANTVDGYVHTLLKHTLGQRSRSIAANRID
ncbi:MAG: glycosyltransferase [Bacteroidota bacterium]